jgi:hypothetical protein
MIQKQRYNMKLKLWIVILITSILLINCGKNEIKEINLENPIFKASGSSPNWKLEIGKDGDIHFYSNTELNKIIAQNSEKVETANVAVNKL